MIVYKVGAIFVMATVCLAFCGNSLLAMEAPAQYKAILVVSFGTSYPETRKATIEAVENRIRTAFPDYTTCRAFTSNTIIKKVRQEEGLSIDTPGQALEKLKAEGYREIVVQPLHIIAGQEYDELKKVVDSFAESNTSMKIMLGKPVLYCENDYERAIRALEQQLPPLQADEAVVMMGHGTRHAANAAYAMLQKKLDETGLRVYLGTVEADPTLAEIEERLQDGKIKRVVLMPYMLVAGDHAQNDLAGDEDDSWKSQLQKAGYIVDVYMHGLGENTAYQDIYVQNVAALLSRSAEN